MNLGLGLVAANSYFKEDDARKTRDYVQAQRDAETSMLPDKAAAQRSQYQDTQAVNAGRARLRPGEERSTLARQAEEETNRPMLEATRSANAATGLDNANVARSIAGQTAADIPRMLAKLRQKNIIDDQGAGTHIHATIADMLKSGGDGSDIVALLNSQKEVMGATNPKIANAKPVASVARAKNAQGDEYLVLKDQDGAQLGAQPISLFEAAKTSLSKRETKTLKPGETIGLATNGTFTPSYTAPEKTSSNNQHTPASIQEADWVMKNKSNPEAMAAWDKVRSLKGGRKEFIAAIMPRALGDETQQQLNERTDMYGALFDRITQEQGRAPGLGNVSSTQAPGAGNNWNQWLAK